MKSDLAKIPFIVHKLMLFEKSEENKKLMLEKQKVKKILVISNIVWAIIVSLLVCLFVLR